MVYLYHGILFSNKRNEVVIHATAWMDLENIMLSERSQSQKATYYTTTFIWKSRIGKPIETVST